MQEFVMMVGLPASGKTTVAKDYESRGYVRLSSDDIRKELFGNESCQTDNNLVFNTLHKRIRDALSQGKSVVYDATNINARRREAFLREIKRSCDYTHCVFMATPFSECCMRNIKRDRKVPMDAMNRMRKTIDIPYYFEGWDEISVYFSESKLKFEPFDYVENLINVSQENSHHTMTLGAHMKAAYEYACEQGFNIYVCFAALLHDIGKQQTKTYTKMNGTQDGNAHYYNHQNVGAYDALFFKYDWPKMTGYEDTCMSTDDLLHICVLINYHMVPYTFGKRDIGRGKMKQRLGDNIYNEVMQLHDCDIAAH